MQSYIKYLEIPKAKDNPWKKDMVHQKYGVTHYYIFFQKYITLLHVKEGKKEVMMGSYDKPIPVNNQQSTINNQQSAISNQ